MRQVFYRYASSRADNPVVDKHDIQHALGAWSWFWILEEGSFVFLSLAVVAFYFHGNGMGWAFVALSGIGAALAFVQYPRLAIHARTEIELIAADYNSKMAVKKVFDAL